MDTLEKTMRTQDIDAARNYMRSLLKPGMEVAIRSGDRCTIIKVNRKTATVQNVGVDTWAYRIDLSQIRLPHDAAARRLEADRTPCVADKLPNVRAALDVLNEAWADECGKSVRRKRRAKRYPPQRSFVAVCPSCSAEFSGTTNAPAGTLQGDCFTCRKARVPARAAIAKAKP